MEKNNKRAVVEALILASPEPIPAKRISESDSALTPGKVTQAVLDLNNGYEGNYIWFMYNLPYRKLNPYYELLLI